MAFNNMANVIFIHGLESSGSGFKGRLFKNEIPGIITPDFKGSLDERMASLNKILEETRPWIIIGSSWGGLMSTLYTLSHPEKISLLILLAPVLHHPELNSVKKAIDIPVIIYHGKNDDIVPLASSKKRAEILFTNLTYNTVEDDHMLHPTVEAINWLEILKNIREL